MDTPELDLAMSVSTPPIELPETITAGQSKPSSVFSSDHLPPRPTSPPPPPRKHLNGLPPRYLDHLRRLLRQWLEQQLRDDDGVPGQEERQRLWDDKRVKELERALWEGVILPRQDGSRAGLLGLDWNTWAVGAAERKRVWREQKRGQGPLPSSKDGDKKLVRPPQKRGSTSDPEPSTSGSHPRLAASTSHPATPDRRSPRPPSVTSTVKDGPSKLRNVDTAEKEVLEKSKEDEVEKEEAWRSAITSLRGYEALPKGFLPVEEDEDTPPSTTSTVRFPGAFPQSHDGRRPRPPPKDTMAALGLPEAPEEPFCRLVKPVFCLHFPSPTASNTSSSSLLLQRTSSVASTIRRRQSSSNGKWWPSGSGSQRSWTGLSHNSYADEPIAVEFVPGRFSLPSPAGPSRQPSTLKARSRARGDTSDDSPPVGSPQSITITETDEDGSDSDTEPAGSRIRKPRDVSLIIGGGENDIPDQSVPENECRIVGGTILFSGMNRDEDQQALARVLRVSLYTIYAMTLELELLDAFRVPRESDGVDATLAPSLPPKTPITSDDRRRSVKDKGDKTKGFFNRLGRDTKGIFGTLLPRPRKDSTPHAPIVGLPAQIGPQTPHSALSGPMSTPSSSNAFDPSTPPISQTTDRHLRTLQKLEAMLPSTTPGLAVPMPSLLLRVREEDRVRREKAKQEVEDGTIAETKSFFLASSGITTAELKGRAMGYRMGGDVRAGLGALVSGMDTVEGWIRLQRLETLSCSGPDDTTASLCEAPKGKSAIFWDESTDQTIEEFILDSAADSCGCEIKDCKVDKADHVRWLLHGDRRVGIKLKKLDAGEPKAMDVWTRCIECGASTEPRQLGEVGRLYSFSKLLELLIYNHPLEPTICKHSDPPKYLRYIRGPAGVLMLYVEPVNVLDTRLPKLQVGPNVGKRKPGQANAEAAISGLMSRERKETQTEELKGQVDGVFEVLLTRLNLLQRYVQAERDTGPADEMEKKDDEGSVVDPLSKAEESLASLLREVEGSRSVLLDLCSNHPSTQLNDIRLKLESAIRDAEDRMAAWQKEYDVPEEFKDLPLDLPDYLANEKIHALPGSSILIREDEPSSVFAYALSSLPYFLELVNGHKAAPAISDRNGSTEVPSDVSKTNKAGWEIEIKRRDAPRDILSLRALTTKRSEASMAKLDPKAPMTPKPNQPSLELSLEQVEGTMSKSSLLETGSRPRSPSNSESDTGYATPRDVSSRMMRRTSDSEHQSSAPPSSFRPSSKRAVSHTVPPSPKLTAIIPPSSASRPHTPDTASKDTWSSSVTGSLTSSFNTLLRIGSDMGTIRMRGGDRALTSLIGPLSMMSAMDNSLTPQAVLDKPHLQFTYTLEDRLKIGCTIYYATAFDSLRRRCAIDRSMISSLARCDPWEAQGGKSKASFFMTRDKRYIVKQLVSKWNVSDTQALLEIAPVYFEHLAGTHNRATALTKIVGFYTFKLNDLKNGQKTSMDLLVMENLFYKQDIAQRFDLKGIEGRKAPKGSEAGIQFDSEWLEGQTKSPILLYPHAKRILQEAISLDTRFLSRESIMDYSLLLGLDANKKELVVGLVDAIGSFNLFKTIESRGKLALTRGGEVTVIPPDQYRERFENAIRQYFIACPDKWSKTSRRNPTMTDALPSIL